MATPQVRPNATPLSVRPPPGIVSGALEPLAREARAQSDSFAQHAEAMAAIDNKAAVDGATVTLAQRLGQIDETFRNDNKGIAASDNLTTVYKEIEGARGELAGTLRSPAAKEAFNTASRIATLQTTQRLASFASAERKDYNTRQIQGKVDLLLTTANAQNFDEVMEAATKELAVMATPQLQGWSPEEFQSKVQAMKGQAALYISATIAPVDPLAAQAFYDTHKENMTLQQRAQIEGQIRNSSQNIMVMNTVDAAVAGAVKGGPQEWRQAIANIESGGGNYKAIGPVTKSGDRAYGKYQVMGANIPKWTKEVLGKKMTPQQFLADTAAQDRVFDAVFGSYVEKYGSAEEAASLWFTGRPTAQGAALKDVNGMTGAEYVRRFSGGAQPRGTVAERLIETQASVLASFDATISDPVLREKTKTEYMQRVNRAAEIENDVMKVAKERLVNAAAAKNLTSLAQLQQAYPGALADLETLGPRGQDLLQNQMTAAGNAWDPVKQDRYFFLKGLATSNPQAFLNTNMTQENLPFSAQRQLFDLQNNMRKQAQKGAFMQTSINRALGNEFVKQGMVSAGMAKDTPEYNVFTGRLSSELEEWAAANPGKKITDKELASLAMPLLAERPARNMLFGVLDVGKTTLPPGIPESEMERIRKEVEPTIGRKLQDFEVGQLYQQMQNAAGAR